jgi:hypothetical protein
MKYLQNLTVIHLVSDQPMANLLPLMAIRPRHVIQIASNQPKFHKIASDLETAARIAGIVCTFEVLSLPSDNPLPEEVSSVISRHISCPDSTIINATGGTKLMSTGAYLAAKQASCPVLYCDSQGKKFLSVAGEAFPFPIRSFSEVAQELSLPIIMGAHGKAPEHWKFDSASESEIAFGKDAWDIRNQAKSAFDSKRYGNPLRDFFRQQNGRIPKQAQALLALSQANIMDAFQDHSPDQDVLRFFQAASQSGFLQQEADGFTIAPLPSEKRKHQSHIEKIANILDGSWLELSVLSFALQSKRYRDLHWSVEPSKAGTDNADFGETDIVAVNIPTASLEVISCKTGLKQPLEHIEGLRSRAIQLGGNHAIATLAVFHADSPLETQLRRWGKYLGVRILIGEEIPKYFDDRV